VRVGWHTPWVVASLAPQRGPGRLFEELRTVAATLRRQLLARAIRRADRCSVQQEHRGESECVEGDSHGSEIRVYRSSERLQQIQTRLGRAREVKPWRVDVG